MLSHIRRNSLWLQCVTAHDSQHGMQDNYRTNNVKIRVHFPLCITQSVAWLWWLMLLCTPSPWNGMGVKSQGKPVLISDTRFTELPAFHFSFPVLISQCLLISPQHPGKHLGQCKPAVSSHCHEFILPRGISVVRSRRCSSLCHSEFRSSDVLPSLFTLSFCTFRRGNLPIYTK